MNKKKFFKFFVIFASANIALQLFVEWMGWPIWYGHAGFVALVIVYSVIDLFLHKRKMRKMDIESNKKLEASFAEFFKNALDQAVGKLNEYEQAVDFMQTYESKPDADHWREHVLPVYERWLSPDAWIQKYENDTFVNQHAEYETDRAFLQHMFEAFGNGERYLVAKLSFN